MEAFDVTLDGVVHRFFPGATIQDLVNRLGPDDQIAVRNGLAVVTDQWGHQVGEGGALRPGAAYSLMRMA